MSERRILLFLFFGMFYISTVMALELPAPLADINVQSTINGELGKGLGFKYHVFNPSKNEQAITYISVDISMGKNDLLVSNEELVNGRCYHQYSSADMADQFPMVPVGVDAPLGFAYERPKVTKWGCGLAYGGHVSWGAADDPFLIQPSQNLGGYTLSSYGLPAIRDIMVRGDYSLTKKDIPSEDMDEYTTHTYSYLDRIYKHLSYYGKVVAPKAPPKNYKPEVFLDYISTMLYESKKLGWIKDTVTSTELGALLQRAIEYLGKGKKKDAVKALESVITLVEKQGCLSYDNCPADKTLTPESYALLKYNIQYWLRMNKVISGELSEFPIPLYVEKVAEQVPPIIKLNAMVSSLSDGVINYQYQASSLVKDDIFLNSIEIDIGANESLVSPSEEGLKNDACYDQHYSEIVMKKTSMVPVGIQAPADFKYEDFAYENLQTSKWYCSLDYTGRIRWVLLDNSYLIYPNKKLDGFGLTSHALPGIRDLIVHSEALVKKQKALSRDKKEYVVRLSDILAESKEVEFHTKTVAPKAMPRDFNPLTFLDYILSLLHESEDLGWVKESSTLTEIQSLLQQAKKKMDIDDKQGVKKLLNAVAVQVEKSSCQTYDGCSAAKPLSPEGYALLKYNIQYLSERL